MQKHPLSYACAYTMLGALVVFGLAGVSTKYMDLLPAAWGPFILEWAPTGTVVSLGLAFVAAAVASMRSAWHAERALQAGPAHRRIFWLALAYTGACIIIEVTIGKVGAYMIGKDVNTLALTALLTFFAIAPRLVSYILAGMDGIAREAADAEKARDDAHDLARLDIIEGKRNERIEKGVASLEAERRARNAAQTGVTAAAGALMLSAAASDAIPELPLPEPAPRVSTLAETEAPARNAPTKEAVLAAGDAMYDAGFDVSTHILAEAKNWSQATVDRRLRGAGETYDRDLKQWNRWPRRFASAPRQKWSPARSVA
jgi:hypothetical protein